MRNRAKQLFDDSVPQAAQRRISELASQSGTDDQGRALLERLATCSIMKTDVWSKLPSEPNDLPKRLIEWAFLAFTIFDRLARPVPKTKAKMRKWGEHIEKHPPLPKPSTASGYAQLLRQKIGALKDETELYWLHLWQGEKSITPAQILALLEQLESFYARLHEEHQSLLATLPKIKRWNDKAPQVFFTEYLSEKMRAACGQPLDSIVAAVTQAAFDLSEGIDTETIRGRRRLGTGPEKSKQK